MSELVNAHDAARIIGIDYFTLMARIRRGRIKAVRDGRRVLLRTSDVQRWAQIEKLLKEESCS